MDGESVSQTQYDQSQMGSLMVTSQHTKSISGGNTITNTALGSKIMQGGMSTMTGANKTVTGAFGGTGEPVKKHEKTRMKAETVCTNEAFVETLK